MTQHQEFPLPLFARLIDDDPQNKDIELNYEFNLQDFKQDIVNNIEFILNSKIHIPQNELQDAEIESSVLALGLRDFCGYSYSANRLYELELEIKQQLIYFEPRIIPDSINVKLKHSDISKGLFKLEIKGTIVAYQHSGDILCSLLVDFETGSAVLS